MCNKNVVLLDKHAFRICQKLLDYLVRFKILKSNNFRWRQNNLPQFIKMSWSCTFLNIVKSKASAFPMLFTLKAGGFMGRMFRDLLVLFTFPRECYVLKQIKQSWKFIYYCSWRIRSTIFKVNGKNFTPAFLAKLSSHKRFLPLKYLVYKSAEL